MTRQRWTKGAIVQLPLSASQHSYAQMLDEPEYAFFDIRTSRGLDPDEVVRRAVLFRLWVMRNAHSQGRWLKIGNAPVGKDLQKPIGRYKQDAITGELSTTFHGTDETPATRAQCRRLECAAVWDPEHGGFAPVRRSENTPFRSRWRVFCLLEKHALSRISSYLVRIVEVEAGEFGTWTFRPGVATNQHDRCRARAGQRQKRKRYAKQRDLQEPVGRHNTHSR